MSPLFDDFASNARQFHLYLCMATFLFCAFNVHGVIWLLTHSLFIPFIVLYQVQCLLVNCNCYLMFGHCPRKVICALS